ncbi:MAG: isopenicillin N synthase family oxygenase [Gammaproteobacteria bacterium]|nr:isopenicillin N synthase family oxygenase [Gammaproteobacteria bacterium]
MSSLSTNPIAVIDIEELTSASEAMRAAFNSSGFFYISNHGIDAELIAELRQQQRTFFSQPDAVKQRIKINTLNRGYLGYGQAQMHGATRTDEKEVFFWGSDYGPSDPDRALGIPMVGDNQWPESLESFRDVLERYSAEIARVGNRVLESIALSLGANRTAFEPFYERAMTRGQLISYPPTSNHADAFGVAPHTDFGCITLLLQETEGLQALVGQHWLNVPPLADTLVVNVGDLLERWTSGLVPSTKHRVVNASGDARFSVAMFHDPSPTAIVDPALFNVSAHSVLAGAVDERKRPSHQRYAPVRAADYILSRNQGAFSHYQKSDTHKETPD